MDMFNLGDELNKAYKEIQDKFRRTGKTHFLLKEIEQGDAIVFSNLYSAHSFKRSLDFMEKYITIEMLVLPATEESMEKLRRLNRQFEKIYFDDSWIKEYYSHKIFSAIKDFEYFHTEKTKTEDPVSYFSVKFADITEGLKVYSVESIDKHIYDEGKLLEYEIYKASPIAGYPEKFRLKLNGKDYNTKFYLREYIKKEDLKEFLFYYMAYKTDNLLAKL